MGFYRYAAPTVLGLGQMPADAGPATGRKGEKFEPTDVGSATGLRDKLPMIGTARQKAKILAPLISILYLCRIDHETHSD
jgi:hypothetical protein